MQYSAERLDDTAEEVEGAGGIDMPFALLTVLLLTIGVIMVLSASFASAYYDLNHETGGNATYYFGRQLVFALGGVGVMYICSKFPMSFYRRISASSCSPPSAAWSPYW
jgi:cell division protein FtsW